MTDSAYLAQVLHQLAQTRQQLRAAEDELAVWRQRAAERPVDTVPVAGAVLTARMMTPLPPACPDCQLPQHAGRTCQEVAEFGKALRAAIPEAFGLVREPHLGAAFIAPPTGP